MQEIHKRQRSICILESIGGIDKGPNGLRPDSVSIIKALNKEGWHAEVVKFENEKADEVYQHVKEHFCGYICRVDPGWLPDNEKLFYSLARRLSKDGLVGLIDPDSMDSYGAKASLLKLIKIGLHPQDTYAYPDLDSFKKNFPKSLSYGPRVLKQNNGSYGKGVWKIIYNDERLYRPGQNLPLDTKIRCTQAFDNRVQQTQIGPFMQFLDQKYLHKQNGMIVDMKFLPRIQEGELRILMIRAHPIYVLHKQPVESDNIFCTNYYMGTKFTYYEPSEWQRLIDFFLEKLPRMKEVLNEKELPLIWTADFIMDRDENGKDKYVLDEINCTAIGFAKHLDRGIEHLVAKEVIRQVSQAQQAK